MRIIPIVLVGLAGAGCVSGPRTMDHAMCMERCGTEHSQEEGGSMDKGRHHCPMMEKAKAPPAVGDHSAHGSHS